MLDPFLTNVLKRRIGAAAIDLGLVVVGVLATASLLAEKFTPDRDPATGEAIWSTADQARLAEIGLDEWHGAQWLGNTEYVLTGQSRAIVLALALAAVFLTLVVLPTISGASVGQRVFGLRVSNLRGEVVGIKQHLLRFIGGAIDGFPYVIPGLLGFALVAKSKQRQRLGDRLAKTTVIDAQNDVRLLSDDEIGKRDADTQASKASDGFMVDLGSRLGSRGSAPADPDPAPVEDVVIPTLSPPAEAPLAEAPATEAPLAEATATQAPLAEAPFVPPGFEAPELAESPLAQTGWHPISEAAPPVDVELTPDLHAEQAPTQVTDFAPPPPAAQPFETAPLPEMLSEAPERMPAPDTIADLAPPSRRRNDQPTVSADSASEVVPEPTPDPVVEAAKPSNDLPTPPLHRAATWEEPVAIPAPVWSPELTNEAPALSADPAELGPGSTQSTQSTQLETVEPALEPNETPAPSQSEPTWDDEWQAWIAWDDNAQSWLRHDADSNTWVALG